MSSYGSSINGGRSVTNSTVIGSTPLNHQTISNMSDTLSSYNSNSTYSLEKRLEVIEEKLDLLIKQLAPECDV